MSRLMQGQAVASGIVLGKAFIHRQDVLVIDEFSVPAPMVPDEIARYKAALKNTRKELRDIRKRIRADSSSEIAAFIDAHLMMLKDSVFNADTVAIIKKQHCNAEWALKLQSESLIEVFENMGDPYLKARRDDVEHVVERIQRNLLGGSALQDIPARRDMRDAVVVAGNVSPADLLLMHQQGIAALVCESGSVNSHTAILARGLEIPAVFAVRDVFSRIEQESLLIVDGDSGVVYAGPSPDVIQYYRGKRDEEDAYKGRLGLLRDKPAVSVDGINIELLANIELPDEVDVAMQAGAQGVGLYRTEMMFLNRNEPMGEEEQFQVYRQAVEGMAGRVLTIRTLDAGADKPLFEDRQAGDLPANPALGLRAVRRYFREPELFRTQVRAILRASVFGPARIMIPMLTTLDEVERVRQVIGEQRQALEKEGLVLEREVELGGMIEVPAAALQAEAFARHLDFLSIGTNDLIQYTLAADRLDEEVSYLCDPLHPAILMLVLQVIEAGKKAGKPVAMCGEMAGNPRFTRLLLVLGLRIFSMNSSMLPRVKDIIMQSNIEDLRGRFHALQNMHHADDIAAFVDQINAGV